MAVIPPNVTGDHVASELGKGILCPVCQVQSTADAADTGWVECPILRRKNKWICLGCCIDINSVCSSVDFLKHAYADTVIELCATTQRSIDDIRLTCLQHQLDIIDSGDFANSMLVETRDRIIKIIDSITNG